MSGSAGCDARWNDLEQRSVLEGYTRLQITPCPGDQTNIHVTNPFYRSRDHDLGFCHLTTYSKSITNVYNQLYQVVEEISWS